MKQILVIDDDKELCELLIEFLQPEGFAVEAVNEPHSGLRRALSGDYCLVVLDVMLPGMTGFELLRNLRMLSQVPVLMLTARGEDVDRIVGLEMGADDYLPKPFNPRELVARIQAIWRRVQPGEKLQLQSQPRVEIDAVVAAGDAEMRNTRQVHTALIIEGAGVGNLDVGVGVLLAEVLDLPGFRVEDRGDLLVGGLVHGPLSHSQQQDDLAVIYRSTGVKRTYDLIIRPAWRDVGGGNKRVLGKSFDQHLHHLSII